MLIRLLIILGLIYLGFRILKSVTAPKVREMGRTDSGKVNPMVQDPRCKTYIPLQEAVKKVIDGETQYFCSKACLDKFEKENKRGQDI